MSNPRLPPEILDHIVDDLRSTKAALRNCCLVSKSWVPRTRKHLFASVKFLSVRGLKSWKEKFPDPSSSPTRYTKALHIGSSVIMAGGAEVGDWIRGFPHVGHLAMGSRDLLIEEPHAFVPFHGLSPAIKSLRVAFAAIPFPQFFNLILSFPLLEDLVVTASCRGSADSAYGFDEPTATAQPSSPPTFTGSLQLNLKEGKELFTRGLLSLPGGVHFRKLRLTWAREQDLPLIMELVKGCSHTLESLDISDFFGTSIQYLRPPRLLTSFPRCVETKFDQPLESDKTQRCCVSARFVGRRVDHHGTPNHHTRSSRYSTNRDSYPSLLDHLWCRYQDRASHRKSALWAVVGP